MAEVVQAPGAGAAAAAAAQPAAVEEPEQQQQAAADAADADAADDAAAPDDGAAAADGAPGAPAQGMSKRAMKRLQKAQRMEEVKRARKAAEREQKQAKLAAKRSSIQAMLDGMSEADRAEWHAKQKEKRQEVASARQAAKARQQQALSAPQKVAIDLSFPGLMSGSEVKSLTQQLSYSYSAAVNAAQQLHLHLLGACGEVADALAKQLPGHAQWAVSKSDAPFQEFFADRLGDVVYLTADSPHELAALDPAKVYIIGGIVDRNRHKGLCYSRAQAAGVATARLPIAAHVKLATSAVITVNQVVDILARAQGPDPDWRAVLEAVLPCRKRADGEGEQAEVGGDPDADSAAADADVAAEQPAAAAAEPGAGPAATGT